MASPPSFGCQVTTPATSVDGLVAEHSALATSVSNLVFDDSILRLVQWTNARQLRSNDQCWQSDSP